MAGHTPATAQVHIQSMLGIGHKCGCIAWRLAVSLAGYGHVKHTQVPEGVAESVPKHRGKRSKAGRLPGAHGRELTTAGCGVRSFGFGSSSSSELSSSSLLLGGSIPAVAGCAHSVTTVRKMNSLVGCTGTLTYAEGLKHTGCRNWESPCKHDR